MADGEGNQKDALAEKGQPRSDEQKPSAPEFTPEQQAHIDSLLRDRHRTLNKEIDRLKKEHESITKERDSLSSKVAEAESKATQATAEREALEKDLDEAIDGNADATEIQKLKKELRTKVAAERSALANERKAFEDEKKSHATEWESHQEELKTARETRWEGTITEVATKLDGDATTLKEAATELGIETKEQLEVLAKRLFPPKPLIDGKPASLNGKGGGFDASGASPAEKIAEGLKRQKK